MFINIILILGIHLMYVYTLNVFKHLQSNPKTLYKKLVLESKLHASRVKLNATNN